MGTSEVELGKVGYFEPKLPGNLKGLSSELQKVIIERHAMRLNEWNKYKGEVARLESARGRSSPTREVVKAFTSDYDLFDIRQGTATGEAIEHGSLPADVRMRLEAKPIDVQHGAQLDWKEIPAKDVSTFVEPILKARATSAQPELLIEFHPDGRIRYTYFVD